MNAKDKLQRIIDRYGDDVRRRIAAGENLFGIHGSCPILGAASVDEKGSIHLYLRTSYDCGSVDIYIDEHGIVEEADDASR